MICLRHNFQTIFQKLFGKRNNTNAFAFRFFNLSFLMTFSMDHKHTQVHGFIYYTSLSSADIVTTLFA